MLCKTDSLQHVETLHRPIYHKDPGAFNGMSVKHLPGRIAEPEERRSVFVHQEPVLGMDHDPAVNGSLSLQGKTTKQRQSANQ